MTDTERITNEVFDRRMMGQWWTLISERERQDTVKGIRGCIEYGCTVAVDKMPEAGKLAVRDAYARHLKLGSRS